MFKLSEDKQHPIVQDFLYEGDYVLIVAKDKVGKSFFALQLACNLTSGTNFLDTLEVRQPHYIWYISTEGKDDDIKKRLTAMRKKIPMDASRFKLVCIEGLSLNTPQGIEVLLQMAQKCEKEKLPKVIFIDPLYSGIYGTIKDDFVVGMFARNIRRLGRLCDASVIVTHHAKRSFTMQDGRSSDTKSDDEIFGSAFLKASVDHVFYMGRVSSYKHLFIKCSTQRSGNIIEQMELKMHEPDPLWLELLAEGSDWGEKIENFLIAKKPEKFTMKLLSETFQVSRQTLYKGLHIHRGSGKSQIKTEGLSPILYYV